MARRFLRKLHPTASRVELPSKKAYVDRTMTPSSTFLRLSRYFWRFTWRISAGLLAVAVMSSSDTASAYLIARLMDVLQKISEQVRLGQPIHVPVEIGALKHVLITIDFRAEKSKTRRHLTEFWMVEPEVAFNDLNDNMDLAEDFLQHIVGNVLKNRLPELKSLERNISMLENVKAPFPRMDYQDAVAKVNELGGKMEDGDDLGADEEALLTRDYDKPLFVHNFPSKIKAFYMRDDPDKPGTALCSDLLAPEGHGEVIGGSERIWNLEELETKMKVFGLNPKNHAWYVDLRRYGSVQHSGFGLGVERLTKYICGLHHIRDAIPFPRSISRCYP